MNKNLDYFLKVEKSFNEEINNVNDKKIIEKNGTCKKCNQYTLIVDNDLGFIVCSNKNCGMMTDEIMDSGQEWRFMLVIK